MAGPYRRERPGRQDGRAVPFGAGAVADGVRSQPRAASSRHHCDVSAIGLKRGGGPSQELLGRLGRALSPASLFWRVFLVNAGLFVVAVLVLALTPVTVSNPATARQVGLLVLGLLILLAANAMLLRFSLKPLRQLTDVMEHLDLLRPGQRIEVGGARELNVLLSRFNEMLDRLERERRSSSSRSLGREEAERRRLANELHDQVGQGLTAVLLLLRNAIADAPSARKDDLLEAQAIARDNLDEVRRIARRLRPTVLDDLGLPYALLALADAAEEQSGIEIRRLIAAEVPPISEQAELALYRIAQEALTNVVRHSGATMVTLRFEDSDDGVRLVVEDDGRGMIYAAGVERGGIRGMRERALAVDGHLSITTRPGGGTSVTMTVSPL